MELNDDQPNICLGWIGMVMIGNARLFPWDLFFSVERGKTFDFVLQPKITTTDESLRRFSPKERNCYFEDERKLKYFLKYTKNKCEEECWSDLSFEICGCVEFYGIRELMFKTL